MYSFTVNNDEDREQRASRGQRDGQESFFSGRERHDDTRAERGAEREREREKKKDLTKLRKYQIRQIFSNLFQSPCALRSKTRAPTKTSDDDVL